MLLCDRVAGAPSASMTVHERPTSISTAQLIAPPTARLVKQCPVRYVMDETLYAQCRHAALEQADCIAAAMRTLRFGHELAWLEWREPVRASSRRASRRAGVLIQAEATGRSGSITSFWEDGEQAWRAPGCFSFDLDAACGAGSAFTASDPWLAEQYDQIYRHGSYLFEPSWMRRLQSQGDARTVAAFVRDFLTNSALDFPMTCAFQLLLSLPKVVQQRASDLAQLNKARQARGRQPLLEHIEVRMHLGETGESARRGRPGEARSRSGARLHWVRGHLVQRDGRVFWRRSHLRGDAKRGLVASKTLHVSTSGAPAVARQPSAPAAHRASRMSDDHAKDEGAHRFHVRATGFGSVR